MHRIIVIMAFVAIGFGIYGLAGNTTDRRVVSEVNRAPVVSSAEPVEVPEVVIPQVSVLRFKHSIHRAGFITSEDIEIVNMPADLADVGGFTVLSEGLLPSIVPGTVARQEIAAATPYHDALLVSPSSPDYIEMIIRPGFIPYSYLATTEAVYGGVIAIGDSVDIVSLTSNEQNLANGEFVRDFRQLTVRPLLKNRRILSVEAPLVDESRRTEVNVVLELTREDVARMVIAKRIGLLELHKSTGSETHSEGVDTGDVLPDFYSINELRGNQRDIN